MAIRSARPDMVRLLLSLGGDPLQESDAGTPLDLARFVFFILKLMFVILVSLRLNFRSTGNEEIISAVQEAIGTTKRF